MQQLRCSYMYQLSYVVDAKWTSRFTISPPCFLTDLTILHVSVARCCIGLLATPNVDITFATTRRVHVSTRRTQGELAPRTGHTVHLHTAMLICVNLSMTFENWRAAWVQCHSWRLHFVPVWNQIVSWTKIQSGMVGSCLFLSWEQLITKFVVFARWLWYYLPWIIRTCGYAGKTVRSLENTCHTWVSLRCWFTTKRHLYLYLRF